VELKKLKVADESLFSFLLRNCHSHDDLRELQDYCDTVLANRPGCTAAIYTKAMTLGRRGDLAAARAVLSVDSHIWVRDLAAPSRYASKQVFHSALIDEIRRHPTLVKDPIEKATRGGHQTSFLGSSDGPAIATLIELIQKEVDSYVEALDQASSLALSAPPAATISIWAVIYDNAGRQVSHFHPSGWLSGVYYAHAVKGEGNENAGDLLIGALDSAEGLAPPWGIRAVDPAAGRIVLFPSYVPHATAPASTGRIAIGFDVLPSI
jgi:hypothetical protein